ncbi:MAG TPA: DNA primase, partial [Polyangiaceae bacterium]|nr:DNA primase [Polyangiaceae bacterium]
MISPETIALVKERTDLVALIGETVRLTRRGRSFTGLCPFHKEKSPSFHVSPERGFFHCFGCKKSGNAIDFTMEIDGQSFVEAVRSLAERAGIEVIETATEAERREANAARRDKDELYAVNHLAATYFEHMLRGGPGMKAHPLAKYAREELAKRGLTMPEDGGDALSPVADALQAFRIGYAPFGWDGLTAYFRQQGKRPSDGEKVGLLVPRSSGSGHYDRFRHRLMFAVTDVGGRVIAFSGRALPDPKPEELAAFGLSGPAPSPDGPPAKYINSPESPIYTKGEHLFGLHQARHAIRRDGQAILVEGNFDVVALHARGIGNVVAPLGTAFTPAQAKLLKRFAPAVIVLFDGDAAGKKAARTSRAPCAEAGLSAKVAVLPAGMDPDDVARKKGPDAIKSLVKNAIGMLEYLIDDALHGDSFQGSSLAEQQGRIRAVAELLRSENDPTLRSQAKLYADRLSSQLIVQGRSPDDLRQLERLIEEATSGPARRAEALSPSETTEPRERALSPNRADQVGLTILGAIIDFPDLLDDPDVEQALGMLDGEAALAVAALRRSRASQKELDAAEFLAQIHGPVHSFAAGRLASPLFEAAADAKATISDNARKLER